MAMSNAERQARHRAKQEVLMFQLEALKSALCGACERGRSARVTNRLSDAPQVWVPALIARLESLSFVAHDTAAKRARKPSRAGLYVRAHRLNPAGTGALTLFDARCRESRYDRHEGRWVVRCDAHETVVQCGSLTEARKFLREPRFCEGCRAETRG